MRHSLARLAQLSIPALVALGLGSCVVSEKPLLVGSKPIFGDSFDVDLFQDFRAGSGYTFQTAHYAWKNSHYVSDPIAGGQISELSTEPLSESDIIVERIQVGKSSSQTKVFSYSIARRVADGAYLFVPVSENDLSTDVRNKICVKDAPEGFCPVKSRDDMLTAAKATASRTLSNPSIAILTTHDNANMAPPKTP